MAQNTAYKSQFLNLWPFQEILEVAIFRVFIMSPYGLVLIPLTGIDFSEYNRPSRAPHIEELPETYRCLFFAVIQSNLSPLDPMT
jgi:hypothetical protein